MGNNIYLLSFDERGDEKMKGIKGEEEKKKKKIQHAQRRDIKKTKQTNKKTHKKTLRKRVGKTKKGREMC